LKQEYEIVIVEDNPNDAELMIRSLQENKLSNSITLLKDGEEALDYLLSQGKYTGNNINYSNLVVFLDLKLPKIDGLEVLEQLRENRKSSCIPVIIVTSSKEDPDIKAAYNLGANSYVVKPVNYNEFVDTINTLGAYWLIVNENPRGE